VDENEKTGSKNRFLYYDSGRKRDHENNPSFTAELIEDTFMALFIFPIFTARLDHARQPAPGK
jgi:hypothetical protein